MRTGAIATFHEPEVRVPSVRRDGSGQSLPPTEVYLILLSLGLLLLTCVGASPVREMAVIAWLASLALVGLRNTGAALGIYIASVALYSDHFFRGNVSLFERPDHPALLLLLVEIGVLKMRDREWGSIDWLTLALGSFLVYGAMNGFLTGTFARSTVAAFARAMGIPFVLVILLLRAKPKIKDLRSFFLVMFLVAGYSAVISLLWVTDLKGLIYPTWIVDPAVNRLGGGRAGGILMHPGDNGRLLGLVLCMGYLASRKWVTGTGRLLLVLLGVLLALGIFFTYTRAVYLGVVPALAILFWQRTSGERRTTLKRFIVISSAMVALSLSLLTAPSMLGDRMGNESTVEWRFEIWKIALRMIPQRPVFGYGFRGYNENAASFLTSSDILTRQGLSSAEPAVHNTILNLMIEYGLVGLVFYGMSLYLLFRKAARTSHKLWGRQGIAWLLAFLSVYMISGQFSVLQDPAVNLLFFCTPALLAGFTRHSLAGVGSYRKQPTPYLRPSTRGSVIRSV